MRGKSILAAILAAVVFAAAPKVLAQVNVAEPIVKNLSGDPDEPDDPHGYRMGLRTQISVDLAAEPLQLAVARVSRLARVPIRVDWGSLASFPVSRSERVTLCLRRVPAERVLELLFRLASLQRPAIYLEVDGVHVARVFPKGSVIAADAEEAAKKSSEPRVLTKIYDVHDLVSAEARWLGSDDEARNQLAMLLEEVVAPDSWRDTGGEIGAMKFISARYGGDEEELGSRTLQIAEPMVVTQTVEAHAEIDGLLAQMRQALANEGPATKLTFDSDALAASRRVAMHLQAVPVSVALDVLRRSADLNLFVDWKALAAQDIDGSAPVTYATGPADGGQPVGKVLSAILAAASNPGHRLVWLIDLQGVVEVTGMGALPVADDSIIRCYDDWSLLSREERRRLTTGGGGYTQRSDLRIELLTNAVDPDSWSINGGTAGTAAQFAWILVVRQTRSNQHRVASELRQLHEAPRRPREAPAPVASGN